MFTFLFAKLNKLSDSSKILPRNLQKYVFYQQRFVPVDDELVCDAYTEDYVLKCIKGKTND